MPADDDVDFETRFARAVAEIDERRAADRRRPTALWLSHHWPDQYDRCVVLGGRHVCRRCLTLYGVSLVVAVLALAGHPPWPPAYDAVFIWGLSIVGTTEFVLEQTGVWAYDARRQTVATAIIALAFGRALAYELDERWSPWFWGPIFVFGLIWFVAAVIGNRRRRPLTEPSDPGAIGR